jgi:hypothetical protein
MAKNINLTFQDDKDFDELERQKLKLSAKLERKLTWEEFFIIATKPIQKPGRKEE